jgi:hypothetical protein
MIPWSSALCSGGSRFTGGGDGDVTPRSRSACEPGTAVSTATQTNANISFNIPFWTSTVIAYSDECGAKKRS